MLSDFSVRCAPVAVMSIVVALGTVMALSFAADVASAAGAPAAPRRNSPPPTLTLDAPTHLTVLRYKPRVLLGWTYEGPLTTGFEIERAVIDGASNAHPDRFTRIGTPGREARSFRDPTSRAGMAYIYRIRAVGAGTASPWAKEIIVKVNASAK